ncbi:hypothetical protein ACFHW2_11890 [Actinomadura sp. LOL_016]|uniref:hypothetical protein n=1 Tax=unclassified Actinomadura TaxID=2626254 RepID=UPI003A7FA795
MAVTDTTLRTAAAARTTADDQVDAVTRDLVAAWAVARAEQRNRLATALTALTAAAAAWPSRRSIAASGDLQAALAGLHILYGRLADTAASHIGRAALSAAHDAAAAQPGIVATQLPPGAAVPAAPVPADRLEQLVRATTRYGTGLLRALPGLVLTQIRELLVRGQPGREPRVAAARVVEACEQVCNAALARVLLIARTQVMDAHRAAAHAAHDELQAAVPGLLHGWVWLSRLTVDTCVACWAMHGTFHPLDEPGPNDHPAGRCTPLPVVAPWDGLGYGTPEPVSAIPNARAAFMALPRADQLQVMGPGRLALLDSGDIGWADLVRRRDNADWRPTYEPVPIRDLI